jgi:hypothetical protein
MRYKICNQIVDIEYGIQTILRWNDLWVVLDWRFSSVRSVTVVRNSEWTWVVQVYRRVKLFALSKLYSTFTVFLLLQIIYVLRWEDILHFTFISKITLFLTDNLDLENGINPLIFLRLRLRFAKTANT